MSFEFIHYQTVGCPSLSPASHKRMLRKSRQAGANTRQLSGSRTVNKLQMPQFLLINTPAENAPEVNIHTLGVEEPSQYAVHARAYGDETASRDRSPVRSAYPTTLLPQSKLSLPQDRTLHAGSAICQSILRYETSFYQDTDPKMLLWLGRIMEIRDYASKVERTERCDYLELASECVSARIEYCLTLTDSLDYSLLVRRYLCAIQSLRAELLSGHLLKWDMWQTAMLLTLFEVM